MNIAPRTFADLPVGLSLLQDAEDMAGFRDPACAAAIWGRSIPSEVIAWLADLGMAQLPRGRVVVQPLAVPATLRHLCDLACTPKGPERDWLVDDIAMLAQRFANLFEVSYVRLRLQVVTTNACRKFHRDAITGRLVCTYLGTGTQYGTAGPGADPAAVFTTPTGAPILLRGSLWPPDPDDGFLHRSPPIEGSGETRLVLVLDPVLDLEEVE